MKCVLQNVLFAGACALAPMTAQAITVDNLDITIGIPGGGVAVNVDNVPFDPAGPEAGTHIVHGIFADVVSAFKFSITYNFLTEPLNGHFVYFHDIVWDQSATITSATIVSGRLDLVRNFSFSGNEIYFDSINPEVPPYAYNPNFSFGLFNRWDIVVTLADANGVPLGAPVPLPASLPLLIGGLVLVPVVRRIGAG